MYTQQLLTSQSCTRSAWHSASSPETPPAPLLPGRAEKTAALQKQMLFQGCLNKAHYRAREGWSQEKTRSKCAKSPQEMLGEVTFHIYSILYISSPLPTGHTNKTATDCRKDINRHIGWQSYGQLQSQVSLCSD